MRRKLRINMKKGEGGEHATSREKQSLKTKNKNKKQTNGTFLPRSPSCPEPVQGQ
jgi:hypothetical protein